MKKLFITAIMAIASLSAISQTTNEKPEGYWGIRASIDVTVPGDLTSGKVAADVFSSGGGFSAGAVYNAPLNRHFYIEPGAQLYYKATCIDGDLLPNGMSGSFREFGLRIPVMVGYRFYFEKCNLAIFAGPEFTIGISGREHASYKSGSTKASESVNMYDDGFNRFDIPIRIGAGVNYKKWFYNLSFAIGTCNLCSEEGLSWRNNLMSFGVGYNF